jgi:20S proteasome alpha/beta subunit
VKKVIEINPYLLGTMAGGAADCSFWERNLGTQVLICIYKHVVKQKVILKVERLSTGVCHTFDIAAGSCFEINFCLL